MTTRSVSRQPPDDAPTALLACFSWSPGHDTLVVTPAGEADVSTSPCLRQYLGEAARAGCSRVLVDLDQLTFFDASTLSALVEAHRVLSEAGGTLQVRCSGEFGRRVLAIGGLEDMLVHEA